MNELKQLDLTKPTFEANGKTYTISTTISVERWRHYEDLQQLVGFGRSYAEMFKVIKEAYEDLQHPKIADASVRLHNLLTGIKEKLENRVHPVLLLCALFCNYEGEDIGIYDEAIMEGKVKDWQTEGYDVQSFFRLAPRLVPDFLSHFNEDLQSILNQSPKKKSSGWKRKG